MGAGPFCYCRRGKTGNKRGQILVTGTASVWRSEIAISLCVLRQERRKHCRWSGKWQIPCLWQSHSRDDKWSRIPWHLTNLNNYTQLTNVDRSSGTLGGIKWCSLIAGLLLQTCHRPIRRFPFYTRRLLHHICTASDIRPRCNEYACAYYEPFRSSEKYYGWLYGEWRKATPPANRSQNIRSGQRCLT